MSFNIRDIDPEYVRLYGGHYNHCPVRVQQGLTRQKKGNYSPRFVRAPHDEPRRARDTRV